METEDAQQSPASATSRAVTISVWLVAMLVAYVASIGPAIWLLNKDVLSISQFNTLYYGWPLSWFCQARWFARGFGWWVGLWR